MDAIEVEKPKEIYGYQTYYREVGYYITRLEHFARALKYFDEAVQKTPEDKRALQGRAWTRSKTTKYQEALSDIQRILELYPHDLLVLANKALFTFLACEFEEALIINHRHIPIRKKPDHFYEGALQCTEAIENCLGKRTGHPLRDHFLIIRKIQWRRNYREQHPESQLKLRKKKKKHLLTAPEPRVPQLHKLSSVRDEVHLPSEKGYQDDEDSQSDGESLRDTIYTVPSETHLAPPKMEYAYSPVQKRTTNIDNYIASKYLEILKYDKNYLKEFRDLPGVRVPNEKGTRKILELIKGAYKTVCVKQELLRARRPLYYLKYQEVVSSGSLRRRQEEELRRIQIANANKANEIIVKLKNATKEGRFRSVLKLAEQLQEFCELRPKNCLPDRDIYLPHIYRSVCQAHFDLLRLNRNQTPEQKDQRIKVLLGLDVSREPSQDSVLKYFKDVWIDYKKLISTFNKRLKRAKNPEETAWIYHELTRFNIETGQIEVARFYCRKCIQEGQKIGNHKWVINALFNIIKINLMQGKPTDAKREVNEAIRVAKILDDINLQGFFTKVREVIDGSVFDTGFIGTKALQKREMQILQMMDGRMKEEAAHLFRKMQAIPPSRRMSVMPGVVFDKAGDDTTRKSRTSSIHPVSQKSSFADFEGTKSKPKGKIGFSELIEFHGN